MLAAAVFAFIRNSSPSQKDITLTLIMLGDGMTQKRLDDLLLQYTEETGNKVQTIFINGNWGEYCKTVQSMVVNGDSVDCVILATEGVKLFLDMGIAEPINDWIDANPEVSAQIMADTSPSFQKVFQDASGYIYAFPFSFNNAVMHINTDRLAEAGLPIPEADWSKETFLEYCEKLTTEKDGVKRYAVSVPYGEYFYAEAWLYNNGASYMNDACTESTINSPEAVEIFQLWQDLIYKYGYAPIPEDNVNMVDQIMNGQIAMGVQGRTYTANYADADFDAVAIQYIPSFSERQQIMGVDGFFTLKGAEHVKEAKELAAWMSQADFSRQYLKVGNIPALHSVAEETIRELGIPQNCELLYLNSDMDIYKSVSAPKQFTECSQIVLWAISEVCVNRADVQTTLDEAAVRMNEVLRMNG